MSIEGRDLDGVFTVAKAVIEVALRFGAGILFVIKADTRPGFGGRALVSGLKF